MFRSGSLAGAAKSAAGEELGLAWADFFGLFGKGDVKVKLVVALFLDGPLHKRVPPSGDDEMTNILI